MVSRPCDKAMRLAQCPWPCGGFGGFLHWDAWMRRMDVIRLGSLAGYSFEGPAAARRLDSTEQARSLRHPVQVGSPRPSLTSMRSSTSATPTTSPRRASRSSTRAPTAGCGARTQSGLHRHVRGRRRGAISPRADRPRAHGDLRAALQPSEYDKAWKDEWIGRIPHRRRPARSPNAGLTGRHVSRPLPDPLGVFAIPRSAPIRQGE